MKQSQTKFIADFDSASAMVRALGRFLHGSDFPALGQNMALYPLAVAANWLPHALRQRVYALGGWIEAVPPSQLGSFRADTISRWVVDAYPRQRYPAVMIGSSNGALTHLCAALGIPWLPQTFLLPVHHTDIDPDEPWQDLRKGAEWAPKLLQANPELQLHHMHDANQDRLMIQHMTYFRVKRRQLGRVYEQFLEDRLEPGGTIFLVDCRLDWPVTRVSRRHVFQHGGYGGAEPEEYLHGGPRVAEQLAKVGVKQRHWVSPEPDDRAPESEWGYASEIEEDIERFARKNGCRLVRITFYRPEHASPMVADLYRWWYDQLGVGGERLLVSSFILMDPWWTLRLGAVPFWCVFPVESSASALETYLDDRPPFERIDMMLFSHGVESIGLAPIERWRGLLDRGRKPGSFLGVDENAFPADFATFPRYSTALRRLSPRLPMPEPLTLDALDRFLVQHAGRHEIGWSNAA